jgi:hypothetical protein
LDPILANETYKSKPKSSKIPTEDSVSGPETEPKKAKKDKKHKKDKRLKEKEEV